MALCQYAGIQFDLEGTDEAWWDQLGLGVDGPPTIELTMLVYSRADARALYNLRSRVTPRNALGSFAGRVVVHAGVGAKSLHLPTGAAMALQSYSAVLTELRLERHEFDDAFYRGTATFLILSDPTP